MKKSTRNMACLLLALMLCLLAPVGVKAADSGSNGQLSPMEQALAPIALYPDSLLGNVLIAATYPDQVTAAYNWQKEHANMSFQNMAEAVKGFGWDQSVVSLLATPDVLGKMASDMDWTYNLGNIFSNQSDDMYAAIQHLRSIAYDTRSSLPTIQLRLPKKIITSISTPPILPR
jgi:hypothetical protein